MTYQIFRTRYEEIDRQFGRWFVKFKAIDTRSGMQVLICTPNEECLRQRRRLMKFIRIARALESADREALQPVRYLPPGKIDSRSYLITPWSNNSLADLLNDGRRISLREAVAVSMRVLRLGHVLAHKGVVGLDLTPRDIGVDAKGRVQIIGFLEDHTHHQPDPAYLAPESSGKEAGGEADVYAVGAILANMLLGNDLFRALFAYREVGASPIDYTRLIRGLPPSIGDVLGRLTAAEPAARIGNCREGYRVLKSAVLEANAAYHAGRLEELSGTFSEEEVRAALATPRESVGPLEVEQVDHDEQGTNDGEAVKAHVDGDSIVAVDPAARRSRRRHRTRKHSRLLAGAVYGILACAVVLGVGAVTVNVKETRLRADVEKAITELDDERNKAIAVDAPRRASELFSVAEEDFRTVEEAFNRGDFPLALERARSVRLEFRGAKREAEQLVLVALKRNVDRKLDVLQNLGMTPASERIDLQQRLARAETLLSAKNFSSAIPAFEGLDSHLQLLETVALYEYSTIQVEALQRQIEEHAIESPLMRVVEKNLEQARRSAAESNHEGALTRVRTARAVLTDILSHELLLDPEVAIATHGFSRPVVQRWLATMSIRRVVGGTGAAQLPRFERANKLFVDGAVLMLLRQAESADTVFGESQHLFDQAGLEWAVLQARRRWNAMNVSETETDRSKVEESSALKATAEILFERAQFEAAAARYREALSQYRKALQSNDA